jgi:hypothetical protein
MMCHSCDYGQFRLRSRESPLSRLEGYCRLKGGRVPQARVDGLKSWCSHGIAAAKFHFESSLSEPFGGFSISPQGALNSGALSAGLGVASDVAIGRNFESCPSNAKPYPTDIGVHDRPAISVPPFVDRQSLVNECKVRPHSLFGHRKYSRYSVLEVAEVLRNT